jgi:ABC-2 type transport system ATP-binding protein
MPQPSLAGRRPDDNLEEMSIIVDSITKIYGTQKALDAVSFQVSPGEIVGLLGPNGAGKSTLMKILTCFIPPASGEASVFGYDIYEHSIEIRRKVGYLPENNPLYLDLYVKEFLHFIERLHRKQAGNGERADHKNVSGRIDTVIAMTGLGAEQHKKIGALSKGYRQRVGLAQVLLHDPEVLILDEPTSGLDPNQIQEIRTLIRAIGKEKTVLLSTHIMQEVEAICSRAIIIHKGKIVADDSTKNLQNIASFQAVIHVEFSSPVESGRLQTIPGIITLSASPADTPQSPSGTPSTTWHIVSAPGHDIRPDIFRFAVDNGLTVLSLHREEQKLEEVFQELTRD